MILSLIEFAGAYWNSAIEILLLTVLLYYGYLYFRGTRGAKVLTGLLFVFITLTLVSQLLNLVVIGWLLRSFSVFLALAMVVIFQPELRRALAELGSHHFFTSSSQKREMIDEIADTVIELSNRQFGALIAIERNTPIRTIAESGVEIDSTFSNELCLTIFHPKTKLHDGGLVVRDERIVAAACIFPVSQRDTLDRNLGLRHRAGLGLCEESDAVAIVVSEETGSISICHDGEIERMFEPERFKERLQEILLLERNEDTSAE